MAKQRFESGSRVHAPQQPSVTSRRLRPSKIAAMGAMVCGALLLLYGVLSYARRA
jgi:hypothetical protein